MIIRVQHRGREAEARGLFAWLLVAIWVLAAIQGTVVVLASFGLG